MGNRTARQNREAMRVALEASAKEAPLPLGWDAVSDKGMIYYVDHLNQVTTYIDPRFTPTQKRKQKKEKKKTKPPHYENSLYSRTQHLQAKLRHKQKDEGHLEIILPRDRLFDESFVFFRINWYLYPHTQALCQV